MLLLLLGFTAGFAIAWIILLARLKSAQVRYAGRMAACEADLKSAKENALREREELTQRFENLANKILEEKSNRFTEQNKANLDLILSPLKERIKEFEEKVDRAYKIESGERHTLKGEIKSLIEFNQHLSKQTQGLTNAIRGDTQSHGAWGEFILEKVLEKSGLMRDREYFVQKSLVDDEGNRLRPDIVVLLPENRQLVIDSKGSLKAYEAYNNSTDDQSRGIAMKSHVTAFRNHIKSLSSKNYQQLYQLTSPDFVLMFVPVEPAFALAIKADPDLFSEAFDKNIVIVSPSTLLATLRTVANIWKLENQNLNAREIARLGGILYDKLSNSVDDFIKVGDRMKSAQDVLASAMKRLYQGVGNAVLTAEKIKELGANTTKAIDQRVVDRALTK